MNLNGILESRFSDAGVKILEIRNLKLEIRNWIWKWFLNPKFKMS